MKDKCVQVYFYYPEDYENGHCWLEMDVLPVIGTKIFISKMFIVKDMYIIIPTHGNTNEVYHTSSPYAHVYLSELSAPSIDAMISTNNES